MENGKGFDEGPEQYLPEHPISRLNPWEEAKFGVKFEFNSNHPLTLPIPRPYLPTGRKFDEGQYLRIYRKGPK